MATREETHVTPPATEPGVDPTLTTVRGEESVYAAKDVEPTESPAVAREGEVLQERRGPSPLLSAIVVLIVLILLVYLISLFF
ncbi:MAG: hypothetical protein R3C14_48200 [Caldilineaceae bacterium]